MHTHRWTAGTQVTPVPQHYSILAQQPTLALEPPPTLVVYLDPRPQSWLHGQVGWLVAEPVYGRRQGNYGVNNRKEKKKRRFLCPCWGRKRRVTVGEEGSRFLPADRRDVEGPWGTLGC